MDLQYVCVFVLLFNAALQVPDEFRNEKSVNLVWGCEISSSHGGEVCTASIITAMSEPSAKAGLKHRSTFN
jgi:hypothetical protein